MGIYKSGKKAVPRHTDETPNAEFIRIAPHGLYFLITEFRAYIKAANNYGSARLGTLNARQIAFFYQLHADLDQFLNPRPLSGPKKNVITKLLRTKVANLKSTFIMHNNRITNIKLPSELNDAACQLIEASLEFCEAFIFLDGLIISIKNRPTDWAVKKRVAAIFIRHQQRTNTNSFPKFPTVIRALNKHKHRRKYQLSARNYGNLKRQWQRGTYWHFIQP
jgi:hypothetical protein